MCVDLLFVTLKLQCLNVYSKHIHINVIVGYTMLIKLSEITHEAQANRLLDSVKMWYKIFDVKRLVG
uniref:Uncharacterized protein n=1 Tax=Anguilla anguilla TaxID=7936 RepID=A0A0E9UC16_ANGAN